MLNSLTKREKVFIYATGIVMAVAIYFNFYLSDILDKSYDLKTNIQSYSKEIEEYSSKELVKKGRYSENVEDKLDKMKKEIPDEEKGYEIADSIKKIGDKNKISLEQISYGKIGEMDNTAGVSIKLQYIPVNLSAEGSYNDIINFIGDMEKIQRICIIDSCSIQREQSNTFQLSMVLRYFMIQQLKG